MTVYLVILVAGLIQGYRDMPDLDTCQLVAGQMVASRGAFVMSGRTMPDFDAACTIRRDKPVIGEQFWFKGARG